jgi:ubiquinone/menaquinone biosynthesis C-methylase UbiE
MMFLLRMLMRKGGARSMDPLQVSMTGVRMGERFLQIGCYDKALLSGLAAKVGLSGTAAVAAFDQQQVKLAQQVGARIGALIDTKVIDAGTLPFESGEYDMVVIDDTNGAFSASEAAARLQYLRDAKRTVRRGGRIEIVEGTKTGAASSDPVEDLSSAGFKPVRVLAERDGFRFVEGLKTS